MSTYLSPNKGIRAALDLSVFVSDPSNPFTVGTVVTFSGTGITVTSTEFVNAGNVIAHINIAGNATLSARDVTITTGASVITLPAAFTIAEEGATTTFRNGFQYTLLTRGDDIRRQPGIVVRDVLNNTPNTCDFTVDGASNIPTIGEKIEITDSLDGDRLLFAGTVQSVEQIYEGQIDQLAYGVHCVDFTWLMNRKRPFGSYKNTSASDVVKDLIAKYAPDFTVNHVQTKLAKISLTLDGSLDLATVLSNIAQAIGGGHWRVDYDQDVHFFHTAPTGLLPPSQFENLGSHITLAEGALIPSTFGYELGYYFVRHTFVYSDGTESKFGAISNVVRADGQHQLTLTGIPLGTPKGDLTVTARRIYYNKFVGGAGGDPIETIRKYVQINDNTTTAFTSWFGATVPTVATVAEIAATVQLPSKGFTGHPAGPDVAPGGTANLLLSTDPLFIASGLTADQWWNGFWAQVKVAYLYRDGSVSFPSPASNSFGIKYMVKGTGTIGFTVNGLPIGTDINNNDVVARFVYFCSAPLENPNFQLSTGNTLPAIGFTWPIPFKEPDWSPSQVSAMIAIVPDNTSTILANISNASIGTSNFGQTGVFVGRVNKPYNNGSVLSTDPIPIWPNPDGPSLEDVDPPDDLTDDNEDLLHGDSGSQPFTISTDLSQLRNRIYVIGAGSVVVETGDVGDTELFVNEITSFSPTGGTLKIQDPGTGDYIVIDYDGVSGVPGLTSIVLSKSLAQVIAQGSLVNNFFQADDFESQKFLAKAERDKDGLPTDGIHEFTIIDPSLKALFQLYMRAYAELELFSMPLVQIRYATRDAKSVSGQTVHVDLSNPPCVGDFLIQEVTIDQIHDESDQLMPRYTVSASSVKFELNDLLLQIIGGQLGGSGSAGLVVSAVQSAKDNEQEFDNEFQKVTVRITNAQIKTLNTTPVVIIPAQGVGQVIAIIAIHMFKNWIATYSASRSWSLRYTGIPTDATDTMAVTNSADIQGAAGAVNNNSLNDGSDPRNIGVELRFGTGDITGGNAANYMEVTVVYHVFDTTVTTGA